MNNTANANIPASTPFVFDIIQLMLIVAAAIFASSLSEIISYFLLYRKDDYKYNKRKWCLTIVEVEKLNKKLEKLKNTHVIQSQNKGH